MAKLLISLTLIVLPFVSFGQEKNIYTEFFAGSGEKINTKVEEDYLNEAIQHVELIRNGNCGKGDCGKKIYLEQYHKEQNIRVYVRFKFKRGHEKQEQVRAYIVKPKEQRYMGCTTFCEHPDSSVALTRKIIRAEFVGP